MTQIYFEIQNNQQIFTFPWLNYSDNCRGHVIYPHITLQVALPVMLYI